ncbi:MAG: hypothetical protein HUJ68_01340, partial [Clostridia bacterium]|nr:hypothetical protein [Clostridia bacterium]
NANIKGISLIYSGRNSVPFTNYNSQDCGYSINQLPKLPEINLEDAYYYSSGSLYGIPDSEISGFAIPIEINFNNNQDKISYTGADIKLKEKIAGHTFNFALKPIFKELPENIKSYKIFLQLGVYANSEGIKTDEDNLPLWDITESLNLEDNNWQKISFNISDEERNRICEYNDARLIFISEKNSKKITGTILFGPYETIYDSIKTDVSEGITIRTQSQDINDAPSKKQFKLSKTSATHIKWYNNSLMKEPAEVTVSDYFPSTSFIEYKNISIDFKITELTKSEQSGNTLTLSLRQNKTIAAEIILNEPIVNNLQKGLWQNLKINLKDHTVYLNEVILDKNNYSLKIDDTITPSQFSISITGFDSGEIILDSIYYQGTEPSLQLQDYFETSYKHEDNILTIKNYPVISDLDIKAWTETSNIFSPLGTFGKNLAFSDAKITISEFNLQSDLEITDDKKILKNAGHSIKTKNPVLSFLSMNEKFRYTPESEKSSKERKISTSFNKFKIPLELSFSNIQNYDKIYGQQKNDGKIIFNSKYFYSD